MHRISPARTVRSRPPRAGGLLLLLVVVVLAGLPVVDAAAAGPVVERVSGDDRYATAASDRPAP